MNEPLIWTSKGNLPVASLKHTTTWEDNADYTKLIETYTLDGEVVKQSVHVLGRKTIDLVTEQAAIA